MAILRGSPEPHGVEGKGSGIWTDGGIGGMVCVVGMRGRQRGAGQSVCSRSIRGLRASRWTEEMRDDGGERERWRAVEQESEDRADMMDEEGGGVGGIRRGA